MSTFVFSWRTVLAAAACVCAVSTAGAQVASEAAHPAAQVVSRFFQALEARDMRVLESMLADDATHVLPMQPSGGIDDQRRFRSKQAVMAYFNNTLNLISAARFVQAELLVGANGQTVFVENRGDMQTANGQPYANRYVWRFDVRGQQIAGIREYFNPVAAALAFGRPLGPQPAASPRP